jgi:cytochrome c
MEKQMLRKMQIVFSLALVMCLLSSGLALAAEKAAPQEIYDMILKAAAVLSELGDEGLQAFNDPKGEFVWKDTYVFIINSETMRVAAHPKKSRIGVDISNNRDKNPDPAKRKNHSAEMVQKAKNPKGAWVDYYWTKLGSDKPFRKISFVIMAPGTKYVIAAGIYDDKTNVDELNAQLQ